MRNPSLGAEVRPSGAPQTEQSGQFGLNRGGMRKLPKGEGRLLQRLPGLLHGPVLQS